MKWWTERSNPAGVLLRLAPPLLRSAAVVVVAAAVPAVVVASPKAVEAIADKATAAYEAADFVTAARLFWQAYQGDRGRKGWLFSAARAAEKAGQWEEAAERYAAFLDAPGDKPELVDKARQNLAAVNDERAKTLLRKAEGESDPTLAYGHARKAAALVPGSLAAWWATAQAADRAGLKAQAVEAYGRALALAPAGSPERVVADKRLALLGGKDGADAAAKEQAARDQAAKEKAAQELAAKDLAAKAQAAKDQAAKEAAAKAQAAKEQAAKEQAAKEKAAQEQAAKDLAAKAQAAKEQAQRDQAERDRAERDQAERDRREQDRHKAEADRGKPQPGSGAATAATASAPGRPLAAWLGLAGGAAVAVGGAVWWGLAHGEAGRLEGDIANAKAGGGVLAMSQTDYAASRTRIDGALSVGAGLAVAGALAGAASAVWLAVSEGPGDASGKGSVAVWAVPADGGGRWALVVRW